MCDFNSRPLTVMHIDINSCFATIEQQANPLLRGKPIAVAAYATEKGCILAASVEAKRLGIKTGMRVREGKLLCPGLIVLPPDPWKYRDVHLKLRKLVSECTPNFTPKSIDEFVLDFGEFNKMASYKLAGCHLATAAMKIKKRIKEEIGEWLTVSIGISTNRFLAKTASNLHKPDGLDEINKDNFLEVYAKLDLTDLCGIKTKNMIRLNSLGIFTVLDFYNAPLWKLKGAFTSICGYYWYERLRGYEVDDFVSKRGSYGNSYALPKPLYKIEDLSPILAKLVEKTGFRLRSAGLKAKGVHLAISFRDSSFWHKGISFDETLFDSRKIYEKIFGLLVLCQPQKPVREIAVSVFNLVKESSSQLELFDDVCKKETLVRSIDKVNKRWGNFVIGSARLLGTEKFVPDRIAFGGVKELEEFTFSGKIPTVST
jgi:DNA polymerase-4